MDTNDHLAIETEGALTPMQRGVTMHDYLENREAFDPLLEARTLREKIKAEREIHARLCRESDRVRESIRNSEAALGDLQGRFDAALARAVESCK